MTNTQTQALLRIREAAEAFLASEDGQTIMSVAANRFALAISHTASLALGVRTALVDEPEPAVEPDGDPQPAAEVPHYPSSAELAAFRRSLAESPAEVDGLHPDQGAWPPELIDGIGFLSAGPWIASDGHSIPRDGYWRGPLARWSAGKSRSATMTRLGYEAAGDAGLAIDLHAAIETFVPEPVR